ncbi:hypothetical protein EDD66_112112 [Mobilisporobacter senegalensis]|uniref:Uncharacterized protein n=1 Tax=Mobilisporobacter senegalensis TaxID=1329262 RepID=A0A3N1XCX4_9FIRM|nr:hypothetical protein [Mobilisporobacter senegalensis]ROR23981.1 hypothetical protein EDD66_112112 [Mobilisporobacter senegalensis]
MSYIRKKLSSNSLQERILFSLMFFLILFFGTTVISYFILPEGFLKNKNPLQSWNTSNNTLILIFQIFFYNMLSVLVIVLGSLFGQKKESETNYLSVGYLAFFMLIFQNGIVLGTWSFSMAGPAVPLLDRIIRTFDIAHKAGLWEMMGQLLITCSIAHIAVILTNGKKTVTRKVRDIRLTKGEKMVLMTGIVFMLAGAIIEGIAINTILS